MKQGQTDGSGSARGKRASNQLAQPRAAVAAFDGLSAELRRMAQRQMASEPRTALCTTALVHEAWLKIGNVQVEPHQREWFLALAARVMRHVLIDHARERNAAKRGGNARPVTLHSSVAIVDGLDEVDLLAIEQGLEMLEQLDPRLVSVVECHFFAGMDFAEIGRVLEISERTVKRDWRRARAFLKTRLAEMQP